MGQLYDAVRKVEAHIRNSGKDFVQTKGQVSMKAGFMMTLVCPDTPDDPAKLASLRKAASELLGLAV